MRRKDRSVRQRLFDILGAIEEGRSAAGDLSLEAFTNSTVHGLATERAIEIISEASRYIPSELQARTPLIPWRDVADIGNVIRHAYEKVDAEIIWTAVRKDFVSLEDAVRTILKGIPDDD
jgi:uncharacterized protein with HEPN domain